jgi:BRCT domain type II-containing protein
MSSIASLSSAPSALSAITAHSHGHKKGSHVESTSNDSDGDAMTPVPAGTQQNLFSSMLQSLEQVIGVQPATAASASTAAPAVSSAAGSPAQLAHTTPASAATAASSNAALQKYLNKVSSQINDVRFPTVAVPKLSLKA